MLQNKRFGQRGKKSGEGWTAKEQKGRYQENNPESRNSEKQTVVSGQTKCSLGKDLFFN